MTSITNSDTAKTVAVQNAQLLSEAITPNPSTPLAAIASFPGRIVFDKDAMEKYVQDNFLSATSSYSQENSGTNIEEYTKDLSTSLSASGNYNYSPGSAVSGSVKADFNSSSTSGKYMSFAQKRLMAKFGDITLPSPLLRDNLRALVRPDILELIDKITTTEKADEVVAELGAVYIDTAQFGATLAMSSRSEEKRNTSKTELSTAVGAEMTFLIESVSTEKKFSIGTNKGKQDTNLKIEITAYGGDPTLILKGDMMVIRDLFKFGTDFFF